MKLLLMFIVLLSAIPAYSITIIKNDNLVNEIINAYNEFDYDRSSQLVETALSNIENFSESEKILIYQYAAFLAFQNGKTNKTAYYFRQALEINPSFSLDVVTTPPKILTIFQKTKIEFLEEMNRRVIEFERENRWQPFPWRAFFPGWEHWHRGYHLKGALWGAMAGLTLAGTMISVIQTHELEKKYMQAEDKNTIESSYETYRSAYRRQYYFGYAYLAIFVLSQIDLAIFNNPKIVLHSSIALNVYKLPFPEVSIEILFP